MIDRPGSPTPGLRSDALPGDHATGYLTPRDCAERTPPAVLGIGDGGISSTAAISRLLGRPSTENRAGRHVDEMDPPRSDAPEEKRRYGLGFLVHCTSDAVWLEGYDAGVSVCTTHDPASHITHSVVANWAQGAWPMLSVLDEHLGTA